jgi:hypothetical protein
MRAVQVVSAPKPPFSAVRPIDIGDLNVYIAANSAGFDKDARPGRRRVDAHEKEDHADERHP